MRVQGGGRLRATHLERCQEALKSPESCFPATKLETLSKLTCAPVRPFPMRHGEQTTQLLPGADARRVGVKPQSWQSPHGRKRSHGKGMIKGVGPPGSW